MRFAPARGMTNKPISPMRAVAIERFGGTEVLQMSTVPVPALGRDEVRIRVEFAGVGSWDPFEREGGYAEMIGTKPEFPYVLGSEGAGTVDAVGEDVDRFREGDRVFAAGFLNPKGGFYAEYAIVPASLVAHVPDGWSSERAAVVAGVGLTALRGLEDTVRVQSGEAVMIVGASGGIGHVAVQFAKAMGARVFAIASGGDGVALARRLGADAAVDGHADDVLARAREFAPDGFDAALVTAGGDATSRALQAMREGGRVAYPNGVQPEPEAGEGIGLTAYNGEPDGEIVARVAERISAIDLQVHVDRVFALEQVADAHRALDSHTLGKLALRL